MNRSEFLADAAVHDFVAWLSPLVSGDRRFSHHWESPRWGSWSCESLFDAYASFDWHFSVTLPGESRPRSGRSFEENIAVLEDLSRLLRDAADRRDPTRFLESSIATVEWGRVQGGPARGNAHRLRTLGERALPTIIEAAEQLAPASADLRDLDAVRDMNSGFSKIYALLLDDFPIYDSRVACALASFVCLYCRERGLAELPPLLAYGIPPSRGSVPRYPSCGSIRFPRLWHGRRRQYADSSVRAAWLFGALAGDQPFGALPANRRLIALQSAMFMLGYAPLAAESLG